MARLGLSSSFADLAALWLADLDLRELAAATKQSRTLLNLLFGFALRHDGMPRNPVEGTSPFRSRGSLPER